MVCFLMSLSLYASPVFHWWGAGFTNLRWSLLSALVTLTSIFMKRNLLGAQSPWTNNGAAKILIVFTIWLWIQLPWALSFSEHFRFLYFCIPNILFFSLWFTRLSRMTGVFSCFLTLIYWADFYWGKRIREISYSGRIEGFGGPGISDANTLGMQMVVILIFASLIALKKKHIKNSPCLLGHVSPGLFCCNCIHRQWCCSDNKPVGNIGISCIRNGSFINKPQSCKEKVVYLCSIWIGWISQF